VNFYSYVGNDPANFIDPSGTVGWNVNPPSWYAVTWEEARRVCGGRGHSYGCNIVTFSPSCTCAQSCGGGWRPQVNISAKNWQIYYATNGPSSANKIKAHEQGHYDITMSNLNRVRKLAEEMEGHSFRSKEECEAACTLFDNRATMFMTGGHFWHDFWWQFGF
jgi:hypothetical protein